MPEPVTPDQLTAIPIEHRHTIALWLLQRAKQYQPSFVCPETTASALQAALSGAAVDLYMPEAEDSTVGHAAAVVAELAGPAYPVARCGQLSAHGPHVVDYGPDQPRNCPGTGVN